MSKTVSILVFLLLSVAFTHRVLGSRVWPSPFQRLAPVPTARGITGRWLAQLPGSSCVVLRHPMMYVSPAAARDHDDPNQDLVRYEVSESSRWYVPPDRPELLTIFNCASYALGDAIGLSPLDWLEPTASCDTNNECPCSVVLQTYFTLMRRIPVNQVDWQQLHTDSVLRDEDVVAFSISQNGNTEFVHFGKIIQQDGQNRLLSKLGLGPIVIGTLENTAAEYEGQFSELLIYRKK